MYTKFYWPYFTIIQKWLSIDYKTWIKNEGTSNYCNNLNLKMLTWMLYRSQDSPRGKIFCPLHSAYFRGVILQQFDQRTDGDNIFVCFSQVSSFEHACFGQVLLYFQLIDLLTILKINDTLKIVLGGFIKRHILIEHLLIDKGGFLKGQNS